MLSFRYHVIGLVAVFLALGIGVIMGTSVIDEAVVDRLERQQHKLHRRINAERTENKNLRAALDAERNAATRLAEEGSQRLLTGVLAGTSVVVVGVQGAKPPGFEDLVALLGRAHADYRGALWLTDRLNLNGSGDIGDLADALGQPRTTTPAKLRSTALDVLAALGPTASASPSEFHAFAIRTAPTLTRAGFLEADGPDGRRAEIPPSLDPGTRLVMLSASPAPDVDRRLLLPLVQTVITGRPGPGPAGVVVVSGQPKVKDVVSPLITAVRADKVLAPATSSVDNIDDFAGRLATVLALVDLASGRSGHYGIGADAQRLLPPPSA